MYYFNCECGWKQKFALTNQIFSCNNCLDKFIVDRKMRPYKLVETSAFLSEDLEQKGVKNTQVPIKLRNLINKFLGKKCDYADKRKDSYSMKWLGEYTEYQIEEIKRLPEVINAYLITKDVYPENIPIWYRRGYIRVIAKKEKNNEIS